LKGRRGWLFWGLLALEIVLFLGWQLTHLGGFRWGRDEGIYMMRVRLMQDGYRLYREIWTDQLPGLIELLRAAFALVGTSVEAGRAVVVLLSALGLLSTALVTWQLGGGFGALAVAPLLALAPNFFWLSRAVVSPDLPSISLGIAGLAAMGRYTQVHRRRWLVLSGLALAAGLYIKATAALAVAPAGLWLLMDWRRSADRSLRTLGLRALLWGLSAALPLGAALARHDLPSLWGQFVATQLASGGMALKVGPHALKILRYLAEERNWGLTVLALAGTGVGVRRHRQAMAVLWGWLAVSLVVLLLRSPLWPSHHLIVLLPPLAALSGIGASTAATCFRQRRLCPETLCMATALAVYLIGLPGILSADGKLLTAPTFQSSLEGVEFLRRHVSPGAVVVSDYHMVPFRAGCRVPPELATVSKKRIQLGLLDTDEVIRIIERSRPEAVVLWDDQLLRDPGYERWLKAHYVLAFKRGYHEIYLPLSPDAIPCRQEARLGQVLRLRGYSLSAVAVDPGATLEVTLYWQVLAPISRRYHGFVHLLTPEGEMVSQQDHVAWGEHYPSTMWQVGETILDRYSLTVPADAAPGSHVLSVGLYDGETLERLAAWDMEGRRLGGDQVILGVRPVVRGPAQVQAPPVGHPVGAQFGHLARLVGYDLAQRARQLEVTLVWQALGASGWPGHVVFVHLRDGQALVAQHDGVPDEGRRPTIGWREGEFVADRHVLALDQVEAGDYTLFVGLYDPTTGERLPAFDPGGAPLPAGEVQLGSVTVQGVR